MLSNPSLAGYGVSAGGGNICSDNKVLGYSSGFVGGCLNGGNNAYRK